MAQTQTLETAEEMAVTDQSTTAVTQAPDDVVRRYFDALSASDIDALASLFAKDAVVMHNGCPTATGRESVRSFFHNAFAATSRSADVTIEAVTTDGSMAVVRSHSAGSITVLDPGTSYAQDEREICVLRQTDSGWQITDFIFNSPSDVWRRSLPEQ